MHVLQDYDFCAKDISTLSSDMVPGWQATFVKLPDYVDNLPAMSGRSADFTGTVFDLDFKSLDAFQDVGEEFQNHFAARFTGKLRVLIGGTYTFFATSRDGSKLVRKKIMYHFSSFACYGRAQSVRIESRQLVS
jgi:hypothetical protein